MKLENQIIPWTPSINIRHLEMGDIGWLTYRQAKLYRSEFGWNQAFEIRAAEVLCEYTAHMDPSQERAFIAERDGSILGFVLLCRQNHELARLRMLLVEPEARGLGLGTHLVHQLLAYARERGYLKVMLWTTDALIGARKIYARFGFNQVSSEPFSKFGPLMNAEVWELDLRP